MKTEKPGKRKCSFGLSSLDLVGKKFSFEFPTASRKLKTTAGSCLTSVIGLVMTIVGVMIGSKYFDTTSPSITFSNEIGPEITHNLAEELLTPLMTVYMEGSPLKADISRYVTMKATSVTFLFDAPRGFYKVLSLESFDYVDCKELNDPHFNKLLENIDHRNRFKNILKCPDFKGNYSNSEILADTRNVLYKYFWPEVYPCGLEDPSQCASAEEVSKLRVVITHTKKTIDPSNYTHPYKITVTTEEIPVNPAVSNLRAYLTKKTKITDLRNSFYGPQEKGEFLTLEASTKVQRLRPSKSTYCKLDQDFVYNCDTYVGFEYEAGTEVIQVKRKYTLPTEIIAEIGGVLKVCLIFGMVYTIYNQMKQKSFFIQGIFSKQGKTRINQVGARGPGYGREQTRSREALEEQGKIKFLPKSQSVLKSTPHHSQKVKEECFKSKTDIQELLQNVNCLDVLEHLGLNEWTKKMLPQALLIKRLIDKSPILRERFEASKKKKSKEKLRQEKRKNHSKIELKENQEKRLTQGEPSPKKDAGLGSNFEQKKDQAKNLLKLFIKSQIYNRPKNGIFSQKNHMKIWLNGLGNNKEAEFNIDEPKYKSFGNKGILKSHRLSKAAENHKSEEKPKKTKIDSQQNLEKAKSFPKSDHEESWLSSSVQTPKEASLGLRSRKRFGSSASLGRKIQVKSRFSPIKMKKKAVRDSHKYQLG